MTTDSAQPGMLRIPATLVKHGVDFFVIGGFAVGRYGFPRATKDLDIVPDPARDNIVRLWGALEELSARPLALDEFTADELAIPFTLESLLGGGNWDLRTDAGRLDVIQHREGALETEGDYRALRGRAVGDELAFGTLWFVGYEDLIDLKLLAGRDQDLIDVRALREARGEAGPGV